MDNNSRISNEEPLVREDDDLLDAPLFFIGSIPIWSKEKVEYLASGQPNVEFTKNLKVSTIRAHFKTTVQAVSL